MNSKPCQAKRNPRSLEACDVWSYKPMEVELHREEMFFFSSCHRFSEILQSSADLQLFTFKQLPEIKTTYDTLMRVHQQHGSLPEYERSRAGAHGSELLPSGVQPHSSRGRSRTVRALNPDSWFQAPAVECSHWKPRTIFTPEQPQHFYPIKTSKANALP